MGAYMAPGADPAAVAAALSRWFLETETMPATPRVPRHVVAWAPTEGALTTRHRAAIARAAYAAGASEVWLLGGAREVLLPRLITGGAAAA